MLASVAQPAPIAPPAPTASPERAYAGARRTVLVADDDSAHRALMRAILEPQGIAVREAGSGAECLAMVAQGGVDLVLLDIAMPGMSGWAAAAALRQAGHTGPIAMMSANVHEISPTRGDDAPHDAIFAKPFDLRDVMERIGKLLHLEWTEGAAPARPEPVPAAADLPGPGPEHVGELLRLGRIGHIRAIEAKLTQMEADATVPPAFVARMRGLVEGYDLRRYLSVLQELARHG
jgi:CheY-like chemotaxis protein